MGLSGKMFYKEIKPDTEEVELQEVAAKHGFSPRILNVEKQVDKWIVAMEDVEEECLASHYGDDPKNVPKWIWDEIRRMVEFLYDEEEIEYRDVTPYNFIAKDGRIYMIDFGDAKYKCSEKDWFLNEFLDGENYWNPDYK